MEMFKSLSFISPGYINEHLNNLEQIEQCRRKYIKA